jgi:hypothetical protein
MAVCRLDDQRLLPKRETQKMRFTRLNNDGLFDRFAHSGWIKSVSALNKRRQLEHGQV